MLITFTRLFFRASNLNDAFDLIFSIFVNGNSLNHLELNLLLFPLILFFILIEWVGRNQNHPLQSFLNSFNKTYRYLFYILIVSLIILNVDNKQDFIYFQF